MSKIPQQMNDSLYEQCLTISLNNQQEMIELGRQFDETGGTAKNYISDFIKIRNAGIAALNKLGITEEMFVLEKARRLEIDLENSR